MSTLTLLLAGLVLVISLITLGIVDEQRRSSVALEREVDDLRAKIIPKYLALRAENTALHNQVTVSEAQYDLETAVGGGRSEDQ